tara:strand:- start:845 stop:1072 length:228 start_codon:yes stop_codon:yes gene_type:complete
METFIKWIFGLIVGIVAGYMLFVVLNTMIQEKNKPKKFNCTYISGKCTVKPTWKNCQRHGSIPVHLCEQKLNGRK